MFKEGKLPGSFLEELFHLLPTRDPDLVVGPVIGEDAAVIRFGDGFLVVHSDPITAAVSRIGWYAIHIAANDIAVKGVRPKWFLPVVLLYPGISREEIHSIFRDMGRAAEELDAVIVGGHTEVSPGLDRPIISVTAMGYTHGRVVLTRDARPGDIVLVVGRIGGEGAAVLAHDYGDVLVELGVDRRVVDEAKKYIEDISVVDKALLLKEVGVNAMHDPTEGGLIQALREIALASRTSIIVDADRIDIDDNVKKIAEIVGIDPLKLLSSGSVVATVPASRIKEVTRVLEEKGIKYSLAGNVVAGDAGKVVVVRDGERMVVDKDVVDEIYSAISMIGSMKRE